MPDAIEKRQYITRASVDTLIGQLKEIAARHPRTQANDQLPLGATPDDSHRQRATSASDADRGTAEPSKNRGAETDGEASEKKIKALEDKIFNLKVENQAKDQVVIMLRDQIKEDRNHYSDKLTRFGRRVGQLETRMKQLTAGPGDNVATPDDDEAFNDGAIDAEFDEAPAV